MAQFIDRRLNGKNKSAVKKATTLLYLALVVSVFLQSLVLVWLVLTASSVLTSTRASSS